VTDDQDAVYAYDRLLLATVVVTSSGQFIGTLANKGGRRYGDQFAAAWGDKRHAL
jgi:hypothetical protein